MTWQDFFALGSLVVAGAVAYWGHRRGQKSDEVSEQSGIATETRAGTQQIIDGLNSLIDQYQEGAALHRDTVQYLESRIAFLLNENKELKAENVRIKKQYGENVS